MTTLVIQWRVFCIHVLRRSPCSFCFLQFYTTMVRRLYIVFCPLHTCQFLTAFSEGPNCTLMRFPICCARSYKVLFQVLTRSFIFFQRLQYAFTASSVRLSRYHWFNPGSWHVLKIDTNLACNAHWHYNLQWGAVTPDLYDKTTYEEKKEEIWLSPMTKAPTPTEMSKGQSDNTNNATKKFD